MLTHLSITNIVLIRQAHITLQGGLCVLTGETGAGKSILLDALGLILGARANISLIRRGESEATITAMFDISNNRSAHDVMQELGILAEEREACIRRTLNSEGKTRCFINDTPVSVQALKRLGETLVEVHGQHDQKQLFEAAYHRAMLDQYAGLHGTRTEVSHLYMQWQTLVKEVQHLEAELARAAEDQEFMQHLVAELTKLAPEEGEEHALTDQRTAMMQGEKRAAIIDDALTSLTQPEGLSLKLRNIQKHLLRSQTSEGEVFAHTIDQLDQAATLLDDVESELIALGQETAFDPRVLEVIEERLFALKAAGRKYHASADELITLLASTQATLNALDTSDIALQHKRTACQKARAAYIEHAEILSADRHKAAVKLQKAVEKELTSLHMAGTRLHIATDTLAESGWGAHGIDHIHFLMATNVGKEDVTDFYPLSKIASGGELSRFMLALKVVLSGGNGTSTLIFDEIDTGTGGAVAGAIGKRLARLGEMAQVLVVTHLPQVAASGSQHLFIHKKQVKGEVVTSVTELDEAMREQELARMLAGEEVTEEARSAAKKLMEEAA